LSNVRKSAFKVTSCTPDNRGPDSLNDPLSYSRAKAVADYLTERGVPRAAIDQPYGKGRRQPKGFTDPQTAVIVERHNATDDQRARNRRVEILVYGTGARDRGR
jgi:outer membrane protein OmpA-like peptidoglycan-associated protein